MSQEDEHTRSTEQGSRRPSGAVESPKGSRLPPPAFPPGARRREIRRGPGDAREELGDAYISPDEPMPPRRTPPGDAFISPDEPPPAPSDITKEAFIFPEASEARTSTSDAPETDEVEVTGMGSDAHMSPQELVAGGDPYVMELMEQVAKLAESLKRRGEAGLHASPEMSRFEATLRAYCVGYLAGRRAEDEAG